MASLFRKTDEKLELFTDVDMLLMAEKGIRRGICQSCNIQISKSK